MDPPPGSCPELAKPQSLSPRVAAVSLKLPGLSAGVSFREKAGEVLEILHKMENSINQKTKQNKNKRVKGMRKEMEQFSAFESASCFISSFPICPWKADKPKFLCFRVVSTFSLGGGGVGIKAQGHFGFVGPQPYNF